MVNPLFSQKDKVSLTVNEEIKKLFQEIYRKQHQPPVNDDEPKIRVSEIISKAAFFYEKIRNTVDDKEEHLLHKNAIDRIIRRQIVIEQMRDPEDIAKHLLSELIRAGYLPNNKIPESKIQDVAVIVKKYLSLRRMSAPVLDTLPSEEKKDINRWFISLTACEIEGIIKRDSVAQLAINILYQNLVKNIELPDNSPYLRDKEILIYTGVYRSYLKADSDMISYVLFKYYIADWATASDTLIAQTAANIASLYQAIKFQDNHPLVPRLSKVIDRYALYFSILREVIEHDPVTIYNEIKSDPKAFPRNIKNACAKRYKSTKRKLWRAGIRSIIYLFATKMLLVVLLEVPLAQFLLDEKINLFTLGINVSFPPILLFLIILFTALPGEKNTNKIIEGVEELVFVEKERKDAIRMRPIAKRTKAVTYFFNTLYAVTFFITFGGVIYVLDQKGFNFISISIFVLFLALISFFSIRIRKRVRELLVIDASENIFLFISDFFYVPIVAVGKWIAEKFSRLNLIVFFLDFIIEAPFKIFVEIFEEWSKYVRERKEDISQ